MLEIEQTHRCIEFDVSFTSDGVAVVFHDDTLDRTTNGKGPVDNMSFQVGLIQLHYIGSLNEMSNNDS